eukprot:scaffold6764_cov115-Isochrysis_galbana.AAC.1
MTAACGPAGFSPPPQRRCRMLPLRPGAVPALRPGLACGPSPLRYHHHPGHTSLLGTRPHLRPDSTVLGSSCLGAADLADVVLLLFELARANADVEPLGHEHRAGGGIVALAALRVVVEHEGFVFPPEIAALADDVIDRSKDVLEFKEELARPIEAERRAHHAPWVRRRDARRIFLPAVVMSPSGVLILRFSRLPLSILRPARAHALLRWERLIRLAMDLSFILTTRWVVASERALARARTLALSLEAPPFLVSSSP